MMRQLKRCLPWWSLDGRWEYTLAEMEIKESGFETIETYIRRRQNTFRQFIVTQPIMYLYEAAERKRGAWLGMWCW